MLHSRCQAEIVYLRAELAKANERIAAMIDPMLEHRQATALRLKAVAEGELVRAREGKVEPGKKATIIPHSAVAVSRMRGLEAATASPIAEKSSEEVEDLFVQKDAG